MSEKQDCHDLLVATQGDLCRAVDKLYEAFDAGQIDRERTRAAWKHLYAAQMSVTAASGVICREEDKPFIPVNPAQEGFEGMRP